jgi:prophage antirepressor-like protein
LVFRSNKPEALKFIRWVTHEVLPALRKQGFYATEEGLRNFTKACIAEGMTAIFDVLHEPEFIDLQGVFLQKFMAAKEAMLERISLNDIAPTAPSINHMDDFNTIPIGEALANDTNKND